MKKWSVESLNQFCQNSLVSHLGIEITAIAENLITGKMPVDERTRQPLGLLHGGASVAFIETLASLGAMLATDNQAYLCVGLEVNANHIKAVSNGWVFGTATAIHLGKKTQVWSIEISNQNQELICISRLTLAVMDKKV